MTTTSKGIRSHRRRTGGAVIGMVAATVSMTACEYNPYPPPSREAEASAEALLATLPSFEETDRRIQVAINEITTAATTIDPTVQWRREDQSGNPLDYKPTGECSDAFAHTTGLARRFENYVADAVISRANWPRLVEMARAALIAAGLDENPDYNAPRSAYHGPEVSGIYYWNADGTYVELRTSYIEARTSRRTLLTAKIGCRLSDGSLGPIPTTRPSRTTPLPTPIPTQRTTPSPTR
ncbi:LppA family lipoprotein [Nocardia sp. NPDC050710]|uniref:LppA family lipoprotein n=1 Tax=Nocardia sp. NPDC050710 TaxID=3157220 RepID=UPI0034013CDF